MNIWVILLKWNQNEMHLVLSIPFTSAFRILWGHELSLVTGLIVIININYLSNFTNMKSKLNAPGTQYCIHFTELAECYENLILMVTGLIVIIYINYLSNLSNYLISARGLQVWLIALFLFQNEFLWKHFTINIIVGIQTWAVVIDTKQWVAMP